MTLNCLFSVITPQKTEVALRELAAVQTMVE